MFASMLFGSRQNISSSISAKTGTAPYIKGAIAPAVIVYGDTITSSPGPISHAPIQAYKPEVFELTA